MDNYAAHNIAPPGPLAPANFEAKYELVPEVLGRCHNATLEHAAQHAHREHDGCRGWEPLSMRAAPEPNEPEGR